MSNRFTIETKDFIPSSHIEWFQNSKPTLDAFEEGNMANISPTIHINISHVPRAIKNISVGGSWSPIEITDLKHLFQEFWDIFAWSYTKIPSLEPFIVEHHIDTCPDISQIHQKQRLMHLTRAMAIKEKIDKLH